MKKKQIGKYITIFSIMCLGSPVSTWAMDTTTKKTEETTAEVAKTLDSLTNTPLPEPNTVESTTSETNKPTENSTETTSSITTNSSNNSSKVTSEENNQSKSNSEEKVVKAVPQSAIDDYNYINKYYELKYDGAYNICVIQDIKKDNNGVIRIPYQVAYGDQVVPIETTTNFWNAIKNYSNASVITDFVLEGGTSNVIWNYGNHSERQVDFSNLFSKYSSLKNVDLSSFPWICVTSMRKMFKDCNNLETVKLNINSNFIENGESVKNIQNVTDMSELFRGCTSLKSIEGFTDVDMTSNKNCFSMFRDCNNLVSIDNNILNWKNLNSVSDLSYLFSSCENLSSLIFTDLSSTSLVSSTSKMFVNCTNLSKLNLNNLNTSQVVNMSSMFNGCNSLSELDLSSFDTNSVTNMGHMFAYCSNLIKLNLQNFNSKNIQFTDHMFLETPKLVYIDLSNFKLNSNTNKQNMFLTTLETPLIVLTNDTGLLSYQYSNDHRFPTGPVFDANDGKFDDQQSTKTYFDSCAISPQDPKLQLATFQQFKQNLKPTRDTYLFESWKLTGG
ncbi:BspA family leucine-rich repeat surface protein, partial [Enterococcus faecalis]|uniref:BspA family leucine-rich repeat surface protein n=1 Tax=Enterococcus faecalis TaxID=1351 RepID=UPI000377A75C